MSATAQQRFAALVSPNMATHVASVFCRWLQNSHTSAAEIQELRKDEERGDWPNAISFGVDRYQYLRETAHSLKGEIDLEVRTPRQSLLLLLPEAAFYPFRMPAGKDGPIQGSSDLRRTLLGETTDALMSEAEVIAEGRELVLLPWSGEQGVGLTGAWAGEGNVEKRRGRMHWNWSVDLLDLAEDAGGPSTSPPPSPSPFDELPPQTLFEPRDYDTDEVG